MDWFIRQWNTEKLRELLSVTVTFKTIKIMVKSAIQTAIPICLSLLNNDARLVKHITKGLITVNLYYQKVKVK